MMEHALFSCLPNCKPTSKHVFPYGSLYARFYHTVLFDQLRLRFQVHFLYFRALVTLGQRR